MEPVGQARPDASLARGANAPGAGVTRRRALHLVLGGAATAAAVLAGCSSGSSDEDNGSNAAGLTSGGGDQGTDGRNVVVYASPSCGCCGQYADYLESEGGYAVDLRRTEDLDEIRAEAGVPEDAAGCHTMMLGDYVVDGHVPLEAIDRLLRERPAIDGIALPGMPAGSPGMSGTKDGPFEILSFTGDTVRTYITI